MKVNRCNRAAVAKHYKAKIEAARKKVQSLRKNYNCLGPNWEKDIREIQNLESNIDGWNRVVYNLENHRRSHGGENVNISNLNIAIRS